MTSMLALDHVGQRNVVLLAPSRDANLGALHGDYAVLHANRSNGVGKHLFYGVDERHLFEDHAPGAKDDRRGLISALATCWSSGSWIGSAARCRTC